ncbi:hypothetical protein AJ85_14885 [Alkalihalobacillus alcalophilus ATCC 27647 = CGMCC 1.3604]|uniref:ABC-2 type transporter transmembrane domain-containing protein n=1 Tax=Alkalihalobacillus alcalophilus ATCC 27647 = CGMCC 1.3604 TaxID=1218173 RepID=A0A094WJT4_ALKAL|nr:YhgE/Pip domain-containing protein [Alkalihalobacillus alcalophilus]KGA97096.1 hypothetical protein BALCAV_0212260 [Alkalihalobacillus alcalophilus ATCC 27647 = CGMCC 1.3604]MED1563065.1 YhgE/Pip domain-containing protein [Alkalihalobacillus alcalophilus]THG89857.1 hypothetical protein AJ85_14885 [Alkalihalobacillus alcalophilus ATCC 27647 = CGMCC 1.3604]
MNGFLTELKGIWKDKKLFIALLGIAVMPLLYGGLLISFFWDPYDQIDQLPVAVVNEDEGAEFEGEEIHAGDDFVAELREDPAFLFDFVSKEEAEAGLANFDYYFYVEIPTNFSEKILSVQNTDPDTPSIFYEINEDYNFVTSQIASTAISTMEEELSRSLTFAYIKVANDVFSQMADAIILLNEGSAEIMEGTEKAYANLESLEAAIEQLSTGSNEISDGINEASSGVAEFLLQAQQLQEQLQQSNSLQQMEEKLTDFQTQNQQWIQTLEKKPISKLAEELEPMQDHFDEFYHFLTNTSLQLADISAQLDSLSSELEQFEVGINDLIENIQSTLKELQKVSNQLVNNQNITSQNLSDVQNLLNDAQSNLLLLNKTLDQFEPTMDDHLPEWREIEEITSWYDQMQSGVENGLQAQNNAINRLEKSIVESEKNNTQLNDQIDDVIQLLEAFTQTLEEQQQKGFSLIETLSQSMKNYQNLIDSLLQKVDETTKMVPSFVDISSNAVDLETKLINQLQELDKGINFISATYHEAVAMSNEAIDGFVTLNDGLKDLDDGSSLLSEKLAEASDGTHQLTEGLLSLYEGTERLSNNMQSLEDSVLQVDPNDDQQKMISHPVQSTSKHTEQNYSYGEGLSPYFLSIGLYVGGLTLSIIFPFRKPLGLHENWLHWFTGKLGVVWMISIIQSLLVSLFLLFVIGLDTTHPIAFVFFSLFTGLVFVTFIFSLVSILDNPGRFVAIILLIVQLGGSGGSFPVELLSSPLQSIHGWLPMTYSVLGFRSLIFMESTSLAISSLLFLAGLLVLSLGLTIAFFKLTFNKHGQFEK